VQVAQIFSANFVQNYHLTFSYKYAIIDLSSEEVKQIYQYKKIFKKHLTNDQKCDIIITERKKERK
jgi:hypothetical protein